jgi:exonuclease VII small subunit
MENKNKFTKLEEVMRDLSSAADFETATARFDTAGRLVKELLTDGKKAEGKVFEVIKDMDKYTEVEGDAFND